MAWRVANVLQSIRKGAKQILQITDLFLLFETILWDAIVEHSTQKEIISISIYAGEEHSKKICWNISKH